MMRDRGGFGGDRGGFSSFAPVKVGDELDVKIEAVGEKGDGIAKKNGFVLFVPNTKEGQEVRIRVTKVLRKVGFAEVVGASTGTSSQEKEEGEKPAEDSESFGEESDAPKPEKGEEEETSEDGQETFGDDESG